MPNNRRINISIKRESALHATRISIGKLKLVYVLVADRRLQYPKRKSRIAYIGTTKRDCGEWRAVLRCGQIRSWHSVAYVHSMPV